MSEPTPLHGWAEDVLAMIADALEAIGCRHPNASHKDTPPMMYDDWIKCAVGRREDTIDAQATEIAALKGALENLMDEQNGPPLIRDAASWQVAMDNARRVPARKEAKE